MNENEMERLIKDGEYLRSFGHSKVVVSIEVESKINYDKILFDYTDHELNICYEVFKYYHNNKENFSIWGCAKKLKVTDYQVKKIFDKYLKEKK